MKYKLNFSIRGTISIGVEADDVRNIYDLIEGLTPEELIMVGTVETMDIGQMWKSYVRQEGVVIKTSKAKVKAVLDGEVE